MQLIPAIDIQNGSCVRLLRGDFATTRVYDTDPVAPARRYGELGAPLLHVVDLDGAAAGQPVNTGLIRRLGEAAGCPVQTGGGLRDAAGVATVLTTAVRAVLGSMAVTDPTSMARLLERFGSDRIVLAVDVRRREGDWRVCTHGWTVESATTLYELLDRFVGLGLRHVLVTDIDRDGALSGPNTALYRDLATRYAGLAVQASGGIRDADDLRALAQTGVSAAISGKALLENRISDVEMRPFLQSA